MYSSLIKHLSSVRARIFLWYVGLLTTFISLSVPVMIRVVYGEVNRRVSEDFQTDVNLFEGLIQRDLNSLEQLNLSPSSIPTVREPEDLATLFNLYFTRHVLEDDTFVLGIIQQEFYRANPEALPKELRPEQAFIRRLMQVKEPIQNVELGLITNANDILYRVEPITVNGQILGRLIFVHLAAGEREEALMTLRWIFLVLAIAFILSVGITSMIASKVLSPLKEILSTAKTINETNLTARVPIKTQGELADLGQAINAMMDRLEASFISQRHFLNDAGHELRTPITIMLGHLELMDTSQLPEEEQETIPLVLDELGRMERLVNDLILLAKAERPDFLKFTHFDAAEFLNELFLKMQGLTSEDREWHCQQDLDIQIWGDRQRLTQAIMNLAQNAVQHTHKGDRITLGAIRNAASIEVWLEDTGEGIALASQERIFNRFARAQHTQRKSDGSGLGLAIVQQIIEAHQGQIQLQSQLGQGSKFIVHLPLKSQGPQSWHKF